LRNAVQEIGGAVQGIDDPGVALVAALARAAFLAEKAVARPRPGEIGVEHLLGALVGERDEIRRPLQRHLQMLDLAEIALKVAAGAARRLDHDIDEGGIEHQRFGGGGTVLMNGTGCVAWVCGAPRGMGAGTGCPLGLVASSGVSPSQ
jgi:hypothetical protein